MVTTAPVVNHCEKPVHAILKPLEVPFIDNLLEMTSGHALDWDGRSFDSHRR